MDRGADWPVLVAPIGAVATGSALWRARGRLHVTVVVKASFALRHGVEMAPAEPRAIVRDDQARGADPAASLALASDLAPYLGRADVLLAGHACAPVGQPVSVVIARLAIHRGQEVLLDKALRVYGPRAVLASGEPGAPETFRRMPLVYERALGTGPGGDNPAGVARAPSVTSPIDPGRPASGPSGASGRRARVSSPRRSAAASMARCPTFRPASTGPTSRPRRPTSGSTTCAAASGWFWRERSRPCCASARACRR
ncbi:MAG: DUF2169 domain-containing protein [Deltaproteobacteria bacterium]|nr:DUF2169 domain-containing protein [Deltaproteobacteria bacterium]